MRYFKVQFFMIGLFLPALFLTALLGFIKISFAMMYYFIIQDLCDLQGFLIQTLKSMLLFKEVNFITRLDLLMQYFMSMQNS